MKINLELAICTISSNAIVRRHKKAIKKICGGSCRGECYESSLKNEMNDYERRIHYLYDSTTSELEAVKAKVVDCKKMLRTSEKGVISLCFIILKAEFICLMCTIGFAWKAYFSKLGDLLCS